MVVSISGTSRAIFVLCSLVAAQKSLAAAAVETKGTTAACLNNAGIEYLDPTASAWLDATEPWNSRVNPNPSFVVFPKTEKEVTEALNCARKCGVKVTTLGGNRSFSSMGFGRTDGAMIMNLKHFEQCTYDESTTLLTYGGPITISRAATCLWKKSKRTFPHGRCPDVGMTGVTLAGFGTLSRAYGTMADNLVAARVALSNGSIVDASLKQNADLFWSLRGATSSFGVALSFTIKTYSPPSQHAVNYTIAFSKNAKVTLQDNVDALIGTQNWVLSDDNNDFLSIRFSLKTKSSLQGFFYGSMATAKTVFDSLMKRLPESMVLTTTENDFWTSENIATPGLFTDEITPRRYFYITAVTLSAETPLNNATAYSLFTSTAFAPTLSDAFSTGFVDMWTDKFAKTVCAGDSAWNHPNTLLLIRWDLRTSSSDVPFADSSITTMRNNFYKFVHAVEASGGKLGGFPTYRDEKWTMKEMAKYLYGDGNFARLQKFKTQYDKIGMFNTDPQAIPLLTSVQ